MRRGSASPRRTRRGSPQLARERLPGGGLLEPGARGQPLDRGVVARVPAVVPERTVLEIDGKAETGHQPAVPLQRGDLATALDPRDRRLRDAGAPCQGALADAAGSASALQLRAQRAGLGIRCHTESSIGVPGVRQRFSGRPTADRPASRSRAWTWPITTDPCPTAEATRLTAPACTSPTAKTPGRVVSKAIGGRSSGQRPLSVASGPQTT